MQSHSVYILEYYSAMQSGKRERLGQVPHPLADVQLRVALQRPQLGFQPHRPQLLDHLARNRTASGPVPVRVTVPVSVREPGGPRPAVHEVVQHPQRRHSQRERATVLQARAWQTVRLCHKYNAPEDAKKRGKERTRKRSRYRNSIVREAIAS